MSAVNALHGRFFGGESCFLTAVLFCTNGSAAFTSSPVFSGKMITAAYVPLPTYHKLFPESVTATQLLVPPLRRWLNNILLWLNIRARRLFQFSFLLLVNQWVSSSSSDFFCFVFFCWTQRPRPLAGVISWSFGHVITMLPVFELLRVVLERPTPSDFCPMMSSVSSGREGGGDWWEAVIWLVNLGVFGI